ncbi:MAG: tRNA-dihydrouridine synthase, partial [Duncaniella sp.]|nr:tRNA-dihydrouridine synthase [Duncaniella sp.]
LIGNGDITTPEKALEAFDRYGVDGVMIGRASIGAPWIFNDVSRVVHGSDRPPLTIPERFSLLRRQIIESVDRIDEYRGILHIRRHLAASPLFKGISHFRDTRIRMLQADTLDSLMEILAQVEQMLLSSPAPSAE